MAKGKKVRVDLAANESISIEVPLEAERDPLFGKFYIYLVESGKWAQMSAGAAKVYGALLARADFRDLDCDPSWARLAKDTGYSSKQVKRLAVELNKLGVISLIRQGGKNRNRFVITPPPRGTRTTPLKKQGGHTRPPRGDKSERLRGTRMTPELDVLTKTNNEKRIAVDQKTLKEARGLTRIFMEGANEERRYQDAEQVLRWAIERLKVYSYNEIYDVMEFCGWAATTGGIDSRLLKKKPRGQRKMSGEEAAAEARL